LLKLSQGRLTVFALLNVATAEFV